MLGLKSLSSLLTRLDDCPLTLWTAARLSLTGINNSLCHPLMRLRTSNNLLYRVSWGLTSGTITALEQYTHNTLSLQQLITWMLTEEAKLTSPDLPLSPSKALPFPFSSFKHTLLSLLQLRASRVMQCDASDARHRGAEQYLSALQLANNWKETNFT